MYNLAQKLIAELVGTFAVIFITAGAICADQYLTAAGKSGLGPLGIALAYGLAVGAMVTAMGHISGGHFNPAVTIGFWVTRRLGTLQSVLYWIAQSLGAFAAAHLLKFLVADTIWGPVALGAPLLASDFSKAHGMALEAATTFLVVFAVFATAVDARGSSTKIGGLAIGFTITMGFLFAGPFTGGAMNPARALGPALAASRWSNQGVYWIGPLLGGVVAGFLYDSVFLRRQPPE